MPWGLDRGGERSAAPRAARSSHAHPPTLFLFLPSSSRSPASIKLPKNFQPVGTS